MSSNPVRSRLNAGLLRSADEAAHQFFGKRKQDLLAGLDGRIVEVGAGSGPNFRYYRPDARVIAVEPNRYLHEVLYANAEHSNIDLSIIDAGAERIPLRDASADAVVCTLVLCTVADPHAAVAEIRRILRPGGTLVFLEHVRAPAGTAARWSQGMLRRPWHWLFEGCDLTRDTESALRAAGFTSLSVDRYVAHTPLPMVNCQISGIAWR